MKINLGDKKIKTEGENLWIAPNATVIGDVILKKDASIWFNAVLRGDKIIIPRSDFVFIKDDKVVFLAKKESISVVENIFRISSI